MQTHYYTGGRNWRIADLLALAGTVHTIEAWGNHREGFQPYIVSNGSGVSIGERYRTLSGLRADVTKAYGPNIKVRKGRDWL
jgi:hypothetical protein